MATAQITLTEAESQAIAALGQSQGRSQEELLHEAVEQYLAKHLRIGFQNDTRLVALRQARGIWKEREDLPNFAEIRSELNRF